MKAATMLVVNQLLWATVAVAGDIWPMLANIDAEFDVQAPNRQVYIELPLKDADGEVRYTLYCRGGKEPYLSEGAPGGTFLVEPFACRLVEGRTENESSLLSEDESPYWHTRGRIASYDELVGVCGDYPEFGRIRHFRQRGFELTLEFDDVDRDSKGVVTSFTLRVVVRSDPGITSRRTEQTGYLHPRGDCTTIKRGKLPLMCRSVKAENLGSWEECKTGD